VFRIDFRSISDIPTMTRAVDLHDSLLRAKPVSVGLAAFKYDFLGKDPNAADLKFRAKQLQLTLINQFISK
ncbi:MAG TPA: hypothetical protein VLD83_13830, partial [Candidatus Binatia bacterium]|nr:hypothetical protein [Candidatus Binatia bacterium]